MTKRRNTPDGFVAPAKPQNHLLEADLPEAPVYDIKIDLDRKKLTWGDVMFLGSFDGDENRVMSGDELLKMGKLFSHVIVGGVEDLPLDATPDILRALNGALKADAQAKN